MIVNVVYCFVIVLKQMKKYGQEYFSSVYNFADLISYSLVMLVILFSLTGVDTSISRPLCSISLIILWIKMFYFLRVFDTTAKLIRMIFEIVNDMKDFLAVLAIGIFAFTCGFFVLQQGVGDPVAYIEGGGSLPGDFF